MDQLWSEHKFQKEMTKIPLSNLVKFRLDMQFLIKKAQGDDYESYNLPC